MRFSCRLVHDFDLEMSKMGKKRFKQKRGEASGFNGCRPEDWLSGELLKRFYKICHCVTILDSGKENKTQGRWYTPHGTDHYKSVERILGQLLPPKKRARLTESERFFLLSSAWLHDIGMIKGLFDWDCNKFDFDDIREEHHRRSEKYINESYAMLGIKQHETEAFGLIARFHRRRCDLGCCHKYIALPEHGTMKIRLLSAYLRLADALHMDQTRAPDKKYALMLAYNIPTQSKLHWLKSKFVIGMECDHANKRIIRHLKAPNNGCGQIDESLDRIYKDILCDLNEELDTVKKTLYNGGLSYFTDVEKRVHKVELDKLLNDELANVLNSYAIIDNPSSSALCGLIVTTVMNLINQTCSNKEEPSEKKSNKGEPSGNINRGREKCSERKELDHFRGIVNKFLQEIDDEVLKNRRCHSGLLNLKHKIKEIFKDGENISECRNRIRKIQDEFKTNRIAVRKNANLAFHEIESYKANKNGEGKKTEEKGNSKRTEEESTKVKLDDKKNTLKVLLYGYSELALKALCGFRDALITKELKIFENLVIRPGRPEKKSDEYKPFHKLDIEKITSDKIEIFVCEGQPKNQTKWGGRVAYHDGLRYAQALKKRKFTKIYLVPDAVAPTLIKNQPGEKEGGPVIDYIIVGANGFNEEKFKHSAGHMMTAVAKEFFEKKEGEKKKHYPFLVLALLADKFEAQYECEEIRESNECGPYRQDGWPFRRRFDKEALRKKVFISQSVDTKALITSLNKDVDGDDSGVMIYNPREDAIEIEYVDVIISENGWVINEEDWLNKKIFIDGEKFCNKTFSGKYFVHSYQWEWNQDKWNILKKSKKREDPKKEGVAEGKTCDLSSENTDDGEEGK